ncbi:hypothetical protein EVAR_23916_1 [Eumeta japonica]|uniref:Uncharacterized protein n=1 Tax=Eumeta variegata TaxID=151549 RepID=A0A4C1V2J5_EUMVA|nr:hypothetical protein EVAR_23916_1 [Eumeta japonica]
MRSPQRQLSGHSPRDSRLRHLAVYLDESSPLRTKLKISLAESSTADRKATPLLAIEDHPPMEDHAR